MRVCEQEEVDEEEEEEEEKREREREMFVFLLCWLSLFFFLGAMLGMNMYILVCLTDLQNDFMNPHDTANRINKLVMPEVMFHVCLTVIQILMNRFGLVLLHLPVLLFSLRLMYQKRELYIDVTEIFNVLQREKRRRGWKVGFFSVAFVIATYRLVEEVVHTMLTDNGRKIAAQVLRDAAHSNLYHI